MGGVNFQGKVRLLNGLTADWSWEVKQCYPTLDSVVYKSGPGPRCVSIEFSAFQEKFKM